LVLIPTTLILAAVTSGQDYGPVSMDSLDPLSLSWNQVHWLVRDQIKEVEQLKQEHDEIYNQITGCYGLEQCMGEFDLLNIEPGSKLYQLGLRKLELREDLILHRGRVQEVRSRLEEEIRERELQREYLEQQKLQEKARKLEEQRVRLEEEERKEQERIAFLESQQKASSTRYSSVWSSSSSSRWSAGSNEEPGLTNGGSSIWASAANATIFGPKPQIYERSYEYSKSGRRQNDFRNRNY